MVDLKDVVQVLTDLTPQDQKSPDIEMKIETGRGVASLRMRYLGTPSRYAHVSSPGDAWIGLTVDPGHTYVSADEGIGVDEFRRVATELVDAGLAYLRGEGEWQRGALGIGRVW